MENDRFNEKILDCIDRGLDDFGPNIKNFIYWHYTQMNDLSKQSIVSNLSEFPRVLRELFGNGAGAIERSIIGEITSEFKMEDEKIENFGDAVTKAKEKASLIEEEAPSF